MSKVKTERRPILLLISDRPFVWAGFHSHDRQLRRWIGEREADEGGADTTFTGDPTDPATYEWARASEEISAVVDLQDPERAAGAVGALRAVRPETGVLLIAGNANVELPDLEICRRIGWTDALRRLLEEELQKLERLRRLHELRRFAGDGIVPILLHPDPDPDALASALALRALLRKKPDDTPIITPGDITRPENRRMSELLRMRVTEVTAEEIEKLERVIAVDFQPHFESGTGPRLAIIDHHPIDRKCVAEFADIRPEYGATATMMTEYLRLDDERRIAEPLATALLYGIKTDTDSLGRGAIASDVTAYAFLQDHADLALLRKLERPSYSTETACRYGEALKHLVSQEALAVVYLGDVAADDAHVLADIADFCLALEEITWSVAAAIIDDKLVMTIRNLGGGSKGAGDLARKLAAQGGTGGGHETMARAMLELREPWHRLAEMDADDGSAHVLAHVCGALNDVVSRRSSPPAHQGKGHPEAP
jgi:nanoRNase/pAp phosphatase (c-di-AMP/oligoRNAs hydrolase)